MAVNTPTTSWDAAEATAFPTYRICGSSDADQYLLQRRHTIRQEQEKLETVVSLRTASLQMLLNGLRVSTASRYCFNIFV